MISIGVNFNNVGFIKTLFRTIADKCPNVSFISFPIYSSSINSSSSSSSNSSSSSSQIVIVVVVEKVVTDAMLIQFCYRYNQSTLVKTTSLHCRTLLIYQNIS